jgi:hypothetical protein
MSVSMKSGWYSTSFGNMELALQYLNELPIHQAETAKVCVGYEKVLVINYREAFYCLNNCINGRPHKTPEGCI